MNLATKDKKQRILKALILAVLFSGIVLISAVHIPDKSEKEPHTENSKSQGRDDKPDYGIVFNQHKVIRIGISIERNKWERILADLDSLVKPHGEMPMMKPPKNMMFPANHYKITGMVNPRNDSIPGHLKYKVPRPPQHGKEKASINPNWTECTVKFNGREWQHVGIRCKGNSSLLAAHHSISKKYSFKLDFDQFENEFPETKNQRFYGFKQLNLNNNFKDASLMREKAATDLFRQFGVPAAHTAFCVLYIDFGDGPEFYGIYTLIEEVDDTVIKMQFHRKNGNLYKPDGRAASFANGTFNTKDMFLKTNKKTADYQDIESLYNIINSNLRATDAETWKKQLESIFNVDGFLKWLAANKAMQNWDSYGQSARNYYLYNNPANGLLTWIPWDNNEALFSNGDKGSLDFNFQLEDNNWPLIKNIIEQAEYKNQYDNYLHEFITEVFSPEKMNKTYSKYIKMLRPFIKHETDNSFFLQNTADFDNAVTYLKKHVINRNSAVDAYLQNLHYKF